MTTEGQKKQLFSQTYSLVFNRKFDTAIRESVCKEFIKRVNNHKLTFDDELIVRSVDAEEVWRWKIDETLYARLLSQIFTDSNRNIIYDTNHAETSSRHLEIAQQIITIQQDYMLSNKVTEESLHFRKVRKIKNDAMVLTPLIVNLVTCATLFDKIVRKLPAINDPIHKNDDKDIWIESRRSMNCEKVKPLSLQMYWSNKLVVFKYNGDIYLLPQSYILMIHNKLCDLISVLLYVQHEKGSSLEPQAYDITSECILELISILTIYKRDGYKILKDLESFVIAEHLIECDPWTNDALLKAISRDLDSDTGFHYISSELRRLLIRSSTQLRNELGCLSKILGHPLVNMEEGAKQLHDMSNTEIDIDIMKINLSVCYIKENYIRNYIMRHKKWPPCEFNSRNVPIAISRARFMNLDPNSRQITKKYGDVDILSYNFIELLPSMEFMKIENILPEIKDRTISLIRSKVVRAYICPDEDRLRTSWRDTRLLLVYLLKPDIVERHVDYLTRYSTSTDLEDLLDYLVIRIVPKEKEMKEIFRGFGCKTYEDRMRCVIQEKNSMRYLEEYSDEQALTLSELSLCKKLYAFRILKRSFTGYKLLYINNDASKWNSKMRAATIDNPLGETLDKIFGTNIYSKTQLAFEKSLMYVPDESGIYYWDGHSGGIEGLNQDTWVVAYLAQIKVAMQPLGLKYHILCRGDDVRIIVLIPPTVIRDRKMIDIKDEIVRSVSNCLKDFGHKIRIEESYGSENYLAFSKSASIGTIELPQAFRKIQKTHGANNSFIATLDEYIASSMSNGHSACRVSCGAVSQYFVSIMWSLYQIDQSKLYQNHTNDELIALMLTPSVVGGFPIIYLHNFYVRAESDLLSPFIGLVIFLRKYSPAIFDCMKNFLNFNTDRQVNYKMLFSDPYSVPHSRPLLPSAILKNMIKAPLKRLAKNEVIIELFDALESGVSDDIINCMSSAKKLSPRIMSAIYNATPDGVMQELLNKFESGRSVYELLLLRGNRMRTFRQLRRLMTAEKRLQKWRFNVVRGKDTKWTYNFPVEKYNCPAEAAQQLREKLWKKRIEGVTMPPLQHQISVCSLLSDADDPWSVNNHFTFNLREPVETLNSRYKTLHYSSGHAKPFLGHITKTGNVEPVVHFLDSNPFLLKTRNLLDLISWTNIGQVSQQGKLLTSNMPDLIKKVLRMYTSVHFRSLAPFSATRKSGTVAHHIRSPHYKESIVPNQLSNIYQQIVGSSNSHRLFRLSPDHFAVNMLHIYCYSISHIFMDLEYSPFHYGAPVMWAVTNNCNYCMTPIKEEPIIMDDRYLNKITIPPVSLLKIGKMAEKQIYKSVKAFQESGIKPGPTNIELTFEMAAAGVMQEFIDNTYTEHTRLQDRYGMHVVTPETKSIYSAIATTTQHQNIGQTEMKALTTDIIIQYIAPKIFLEIINNYPGTFPSNVDIVLGNIPGTEQPWFYLVQHIYRANKLGSLILNLSKLADLYAPTCYSNPVAATSFVGKACFLIQLQNPQVPRLVFLTHYDVDDLTRHARCVMISWVKSQIKGLLIKKKRGLANPFDGVDEVQRVAAAICLMCITPTSEEYEHCLQEQIKLYNEGEWRMMDVSMIPRLWDTEENWFSFIEGRQETDVDYFSKRYRNLPWVSAFDWMLENPDDIEVLLGEICDMSVIHVIHSELSSCIYLIRSHRDDDMDQYEDDVIDEELRHAILRSSHEYDLVDAPRNHYKHINLTVSLGEMAPGGYLPRFMDLSLSKHVLHQSYLYRPFGHGTTSLNKFISIWNAHKGRTPLPDYCAIACLGEGYGGVLDLFAKMFRYGRILYNTLPPNPEQETYPEIARQSIADNEHMLYHEHINQGLYDLTDEKVLQHYEKYRERYSIITCDAEVGENYNNEKRHKMIKNVCFFFLRNKTNKGVLIMKFMCGETHGLHIAVSILEKSVTNITIHSLSASNITGELYLVAWGQHTIGDLRWERESYLPSSSNYNIIEKIRARLESKWSSLMIDKDRKLDIQSVLPISNRYWRKLRMGLSGLHKAVSILNLPIRLNHFRSINEATHYTMFFGSFVTIAKEALQVTSSLMYDDVNTEYHKAHWDHNTRAHRLHQLYRHLRIAGFLSTVNIVADDSFNMIINEQRLRRMYCTYIEAIHEQYDLNPVTSDHYRIPHISHDIEVFPYASFHEGVKIALYLISGWINQNGKW